MAGVLGQFANGPIQFNAGTGAIEQRGTIDSPQPSATGNGTTGTIMSQPDTPLGASSMGGGVIGGYQGGPGAYTNGGFNIDRSQSMTRTGDEINQNPISAGGIPLDTSAGRAAFGQTSLAQGGAGLSKAWDDQAKTFMPTMMAFDDGGVVPDDNQQGADDATIDPMAFVKQAAAFGRKQMGLPANFTTGESDGAIGYDDGGVVPAQDVTAGGNSGPPDPRKALRYLTGDGAVSPEIANALEQHVDPQGQMDPAERTLATLQKAPNDEAKFGMLQHYRTLYNGLSAGARAAMDKGQLGQAAMLATQAFDKTPTGYKVHFAPAPGGIAVSARKLGGAQAAPQGDQEPDQGDAAEGESEQSFAGGGPVDEEGNLVQRSAPDDRGVMDDYEEGDYTQSGRGNGNIPDTGARIARSMPEGAMEAVVDHVSKATPSENIEDRRNEPAWRGAVRNVTGYDDGGVVEDDDVPSADATVPQAQEDAPEAVAEAEPEQAQPTQDVHVLNPHQFQALMQAGYDKPIDDGWSGLFDSILSAVGPSQAQAAELPAGQQGGTTVMPKSDKLPGTSQALQQQMATPSPLSQVTKAQTAEQTKNQPVQDREDAYERQKTRVEKLAAQLFPFASQADQRNAYIGTELDKYMQSEQKGDLAHIQNKGGIAQARENNRYLIESMKENGRKDRAADAHSTRMDIAQLQAATRQWSTTQQEIGRQFGRMLANNPSLANDPSKAWAQATQMAKQNGMDPNLLLQVGQHLSGRAQAGPQAGGQQPTVVVFPSGPYAGKPLIRLPDGTYRLAPGQ